MIKNIFLFLLVIGLASCHIETVKPGEKEDDTFIQADKNDRGKIGLSPSKALHFTPAGLIANMYFSRDGEKIVLGFYDGAIKIFDIKNGDHKSIAACNKYLSKACFTFDDKQVFGRCSDNVEKFWDAETGLPSANRLNEMEMLKLFEACNRYNNSSYNRRIDKMVEAGGDEYAPGELNLNGTAVVKKDLGIRNKEILATIKIDDYIKHSTFIDDGKKIITIANNGVDLWDSESYKRVFHIDYKNPSIMVDFLPSRRQLAIADEKEGKISLVDLPE